MKKLKQAIIVGVLFFSPFMISSLAGAKGGVCQEGFTGPNSDNLCVSETKYQCEEISDNTIWVDNGSTQVAVSGDGESDDNTNGGNVQTGSATNENGVTFNVTLTGGDVCAVVATTKPIVEKPEKPAKKPVPAPEKQPAPVLPNTSGDKTSAIIFTSLGAAAVALIALKSAALYRRR